MDNENIYDSNEEIELKEIINAIWEYKSKIITFVTIAVLLALIYSLFIYAQAKPGILYESESIVKIKTDDSIPHQHSLFLSVLSGDAFISSATKDLVNPEIFSNKNIDILDDLDRNEILIKAKYTDARTANEIANAIVNQAIVVTNDSLKGVKVIYRNFAQVKNTLYTKRQLPNIKLNLVVGFISSLLFSFFSIFVYEFILGKVKRDSQLESALKVDVLASTPSFEKINGNNKDHLTQIYNYQIDQLALRLIDSPDHIFSFSNLNQNELRGELLNNLNTSLTKLHKNVCLINFDITSDEVKNIEDYFVNQRLVDDMLEKEDGYTTLSFKFGDQISNILSSSEFKELMQALKLKFDYVIIDNFSFHDNIDALLISHLSDQTILIVEANKNTNSQLEELSSFLNKHKINLFGSILHNYKISKPLIK
jgi:capsular polysaccharide biosynthesis protein